MRGKDPIYEYFDWLVGFVVRDDTDRRAYGDLFLTMFHTDYIWIVDNDDNRFNDGLDLRKQFMEDHYVDRTLWFEFTPCTMLEMIIGLAIRWEDDIMFDDFYGDRTPEWFWIMMKNSGLDRFDQGHFDEKKVVSILEKIKNRTYKPDGTGGLFVVHDTKTDLRDVELWYQMNWFITENYKI